MSRYREIELGKIKTVSILKRKSKMRREEVAGCVEPGASFSDFWKSLPSILASRDLKDLRRISAPSEEACAAARGRPYHQGGAESVIIRSWSAAC
jgi:hypothetical protein